MCVLFVATSIMKKKVSPNQVLLQELGWRELTEDFKCPRCKQPASVFVVYLEPCIKRVGLF
ncbi:hypothetical protein DSECCO2_647120 [anaerobic digester metagenome]